jgi:hypothetical protein
LKKLPFFFSGGLLRCNFAPAWSLNRLSPEVSHVCLLVSISATWFSFLWRSWMFWVCKSSPPRIYLMPPFLACSLVSLLCSFQGESRSPQ